MLFVDVDNVDVDVFVGLLNADVDNVDVDVFVGLMIAEMNMMMEEGPYAVLARVAL